MKIFKVRRGPRKCNHIVSNVVESKIEHFCILRNRMDGWMCGWIKGKFCGTW